MSDHIGIGGILSTGKFLELFNCSSYTVPEKFVLLEVSLSSGSCHDGVYFDCGGFYGSKKGPPEYHDPVFYTKNIVAR